MRQFKKFVGRSLAANPKTLWRRYVVALLILAALYVGSHFSAMSATHLVSADTPMALLTARQETLNKQIMLQSLRLATVKDDVNLRAELSALIDDFEENHQRILDGAGDPMMKPANSERLRPIFFEESIAGPPLNEAVGLFVREARLVEVANLESGDQLLQRVNTMESLRIHDGLQGATEAFGHDFEDRNETIHTIQVVVLVAGLLTILAEACLIFWPAHIIARNALNRLEEKSDELFASNEQLQLSLAEAQNARIEADRSSRAKSMFLANMSHELRTPLNAIIGFSSMIGSEVFGKVGSPRYIEYSGDIERSGQHLLELISDLMDISQVETGEAQVERVDVNVAALMEAVEPLASGWPMARRRNIRFVVADAPESYIGDPRRMRQILLNLLSNAIKFTRSGDSITVSAEAHGEDGVRFVVEDNGPGFDLAHIERLMQPFQRGDNAFTRDREGSGLGLSLVSAFAELHNGFMALENSPETGGARVIVTLLPMSPEEDRGDIAA